MEIVSENALPSVPSPLTHSVLPCADMFFVVYPTPGAASVLTLAMICRTEAQAIDECARRNGGAA